MVLTPEAAFSARPELGFNKLGHAKKWVANVLDVVENLHQAEQVEVYKLDPALIGIAVPLSSGRLEQVRDRTEWIPLLEAAGRGQGWHYVKVDVARSAVILAMFKRVGYVHLAGEHDGSTGVALGLMDGETPEKAVERVRSDGVWRDTEDGRVWHAPEAIVSISFPAQTLVTLD